MPPVSDSQFTDLATLKRYIGIATTDVNNDANFNALIVAGSGVIKRLTNRRAFFSVTIADELYRGNGDSRLFLNIQPVISVASILYNNGINSFSPYSSTYPNGFRVDKYGITLFTDSFQTGYYYTITYTAGFALNSEEAYMAEQALLSLCNFWWKRKGHADQLAQSLGNQITAKYSMDDIPPETKLICNQLKRVI